MNGDYRKEILHMYDYDYDDYESYYEPSVADEILIEFQQKMKGILLQKIKDEMEQIKSENIKLKNENDEYRQRERDIQSKERSLKYKEENLKREVEKEFYQSNIGDTLKEYVENCELWFADEESYKREKCDVCNKDRELVAKFPNGKTTKTVCECAKILHRFIPALTAMDLIKFSKRDSKYSSDRRFYLSKSYSPNKDSNYYRDDYSYNEFNIAYVVDKFSEDTKSIHDNKRYGEKLGFKTKEDCQKYCDWLNEQKEN